MGQPDETFVPWNFCYDGQLKIKFRSKDEPLPPEAPEEIKEKYQLDKLEKNQ